MVGRCCIFYVSDFFIIAYFGELYIWRRFSINLQYIIIEILDPPPLFPFKVENQKNQFHISRFRGIILW